MQLHENNALKCGFLQAIITKPNNQNGTFPFRCNNSIYNDNSMGIDLSNIDSLTAAFFNKQPILLKTHYLNHSNTVKRSNTPL